MSHKFLTGLYDELKEVDSTDPILDCCIARVYDQIESDVRNPRPVDVEAWETWEEMTTAERDVYRNKKIGAAEAAALQRRDRAAA